MKSKLIGDWSKAKAILDDARSFKEAMNYAVMKEAHYARAEIVKGIRDQAPGGKAFQPLAEITLAIRKLRGFKGTKALMATGALLGSVKVQQASMGRVFVGVLRSARSKDGKDLVNIARLNELGGVIVMRVTPRMRRFLMANLRKSSLGLSKIAGGRTKGGRGKKSKFVASGTSQLSRGVIVIKIPPRPFISPVIDKLNSDPKAMQKRFAKRIAQKLRLTLGSA